MDTTDNTNNSIENENKNTIDEDSKKNVDTVNEVFAAIDELQAKRDDLAVQKQALHDKIAEEAQKVDQTQQDITKRKQQLQDYKNALRDIERQEKQINAAGVIEKSMMTSEINVWEISDASSDNGQVPSSLWDEFVAVLKSPWFLLGAVLVNFLFLMLAFTLIGKMHHRSMRQYADMPPSQRSMQMHQRRWGPTQTNTENNNERAVQYMIIPN